MKLPLEAVGEALRNVMLQENVSGWGPIFLASDGSSRKNRE